MLTVASWNLHQWETCWQHLSVLVDEHDVDAVLVQEAKNPSRLPEGWTSNPAPSDDQYDEAWRISIPRWYRASDGELKETRRWFASAVVGTGRVELTPRISKPLHEGVDAELMCSHPGQFAVSELALADGKRLTLISLYGIWDRMLDSGDAYTEATLHRAISDLTPIFQERDADYVLVGGDLNLYTYSDGSVWGDRWMTVLSRFEVCDLEICGPFRPDDEARLERCPCPDPECRHVNTFLHQRKPTNRPHQLDFFLATPALRERMTRCCADPDPQCYDHSDHRAIFATFDLEPARSGSELSTTAS